MYCTKNLANHSDPGLVPAQEEPLARPILGEIIGNFKSITTYQYILGERNQRWPAFHKRLWHRNYYEHIIRNEEELYNIRQYVSENPINWRKDEENPNP